MRAWKLVTVFLIALACVASAGNQQIRRFVLFAGNTDSTTQVSPWIHIKGADRVLLRAFSTHAAFGGADSTTSDSIATFVVIFTDSTTVYGGNTAGADSIQISGVSGADSTKQVALMGGPVNKALRGPVNGWGVWSKIYATGANGNVSMSNGDIIGPDVMRVLATPLRRSTGATVSATVPNRVNGLKGFRMYAYVYGANQ